MNINNNKELEALFSFAPPSQLRQSIRQVFFSFRINHEIGLSNNFKQVVGDIQFLLHFLEQVDNKGEEKQG